MSDSGAALSASAPVSADSADPACDAAHGKAPLPVSTRTLVAVFNSPVARFLLGYARDAGYRPVLIDPDAGQPAGGIKEAQETKAAARARVAQEERQAKARAKAEESLAQAQEVVAAAVADQRDQEKAVRGLERELGQARIRLRSAEAEVRRAEAAERRARHARDQYLGGATAGKDTGQ